jgi:hypothetical protein
VNRFDEIMTRLIAVIVVSSGIGFVIWFFVVLMLWVQREALS